MRSRSTFSHSNLDHLCICGDRCADSYCSAVDMTPSSFWLGSLRWYLGMPRYFCMLAADCWHTLTRTPFLSYYLYRYEDHVVQDNFKFGDDKEIVCGVPFSSPPSLLSFPLSLSSLLRPFRTTPFFFSCFPTFSHAINFQFKITPLRRIHSALLQKKNWVGICEPHIPNAYNNNELKRIQWVIWVHDRWLFSLLV